MKRPSKLATALLTTAFIANIGIASAFASDTGNATQSNTEVVATTTTTTAATTSTTDPGITPEIGRAHV